MMEGLIIIFKASCVLVFFMPTTLAFAFLADALTEKTKTEK